MAGEWPERPLGELVEIYDGPHATPPKTERGPIFLGISNLASGRLDLSDVERLSEEDYVLWTRRVEPRAGDVVFSYETRLGEAAFIPSDLQCCLGRRMGLLRPRPGKIDARFLLYAYLGPQFQETLRARTIHGSTVDRIPLIEMPRFPLAVPDIGEQRAISRILGALDDKIELNRRMNETLEAVARALFKSWFVDFDPVRAKAAGRDPGLPKDIADLFPARLVPSALGDIPEGWTFARLGSVTSYLNRGISPSYVEGEGILVLNQKCIREGRVDISKSRHHDLEIRGIDGRMLRPGDVLVNSTGVGTLGRVGQILAVEEDTIVDSHVTVVRADEQAISRNYLGICLLGRSDEIEGFGEGTTGQTELSRIRLASLPMLIPRHAVIEAFDRLTEPFRERSVLGDREGTALAALRDALLPKLISGEIRVKVAAAPMEWTARTDF